MQLDTRNSHVPVSHRQSTIALLTASLEESRENEVWSGVIDAAREQGMNLLNHGCIRRKSTYRNVFGTIVYLQRNPYETVVKTLIAKYSCV